jgi:hypothetical protein
MLAWISRLDLGQDAVELGICPPSALRSRGPASLLAEIQPRLRAGEDAWIWNGAVRLHLTVRLQMRGGRSWLSGVEGASGHDHTHAAKALLRQLRAAHAGLRACNFGPGASLDVIKEATAPKCAYARKIAPLAFIAPDLQRALVEGKISPRCGGDALLAEGLPLLWSDQRASFTAKGSGGPRP